MTYNSLYMFPHEHQGVKKEVVYPDLHRFLLAVVISACNLRASFLNAKQKKGHDKYFRSNTKSFPKVKSRKPLCVVRLQ